MTVWHEYFVLNGGLERGKMKGAGTLRKRNLGGGISHQISHTSKKGPPYFILYFSTQKTKLKFYYFF